MFFYIFLGVFIGGRLGYILFYNLSYTIENPITIFYLWNGGMSFHGGFIGVFLVLFISVKKIGFLFLISDFIVKLVPIGLFTGRIGNFINGELIGKPADISWGVVFPKIDNLSRHPSQLYEAFLEGIILFIILNFIISKNVKVSYVTAYFLIIYSLFRFIIEFLRLPDPHIGYIAFNWVTMGQILCVPMFLLGLYILKIRNGD